MILVNNVSRRGFLRDICSAGALLLAARFVPEEAFAAGYTSQTEKRTFTPSHFLGIDPDGTVWIVTHRSEMGTGVRTSLPMVVADELDADWSRVKIEQAIGNAEYGSQNTDGSCSIRDFFDVMREVGATARLMLEQAAARQWSVPASECKANLHKVVHQPTGKEAAYGDLVETAAKLPVPGKGDLRFKKKSEYRYIGKDAAPIYDLKDLCTGNGIFGMDAKVEGMVFASITRSPVLGGKVKSVDDTETRKVSGVTSVVEVPAFKPPHAFQALGGVAVIANSTWAAFQGRSKLKIEWETSPHAVYDSASFKDQLQKTARQPGKVARNIGDVDRVLAEGAQIHEADYYVPLLSHAAMEPPAAVAEYKDGTVVAWAPTQNPQAVQEAVAAALGIDKTDVVCHVTLLGGGFGRKSKPDYVVEAALLSKQLGKPVKVVWTREDDIRHDYYHTVAATYIKAALDDAGKPQAWLQRSVFPSIDSTFKTGVRYSGSLELGMGWSDVPYDIPNHRAENGPADAHVRIGWMRSVANIYHAFSVCSFADELAHLAGRDTKDYLLELIGEPRLIDLPSQGVEYDNMGSSLKDYPVDTGRLRHVVELVAEKSGWGNRKLPKGHALGIAAHRSFLTYVAVVAEVAVDEKGKVSVPRMDIAADAGLVVHPERVRAQFEGASIFGLSLALMGEITATKGAIDQSNFHDYPVVRINDAPREIHVHLVESDAPPAGVGEPGVPPVAPALCNAIFAVTGKRIRELPLSKHQFV